MTVLSWNLFHGRDLPPGGAPRPLPARLVRPQLLDGFADRLAGWHWDLALLQEAPPRWQRALALRARASSAIALTARNEPACLRRRLADWAPDLLAANEGGSNQLLVRAPGRLLAVRRLRLAWRPERRRMLWARVELPGGARLAVGNLHASAGLPERAAGELERAAARALEWAGRDPLVLGGDLNLRPARQPDAFTLLRERFGLGQPTAPGAIDHLLAHGLELVEPPRALPASERELTSARGERLLLSDHAPVVASFGMR
ncbi:MAG: endonuclease/exonuclease/phosphatase family protein [Nocardioidaceae bacterium]